LRDPLLHFGVFRATHCPHLGVFAPFEAHNPGEMAAEILDPSQALTSDRTPAFI
jgi:hypothetical protein